ncbi:MAG TPA: glycosyltransferase [Crocinitomicaceae bacterium]|nr:glycosyltransferase [Crocinitomicaceae bacterium]
MATIIIFYFLIYTVLIGILVLVGFFLQVKKEENYHVEKSFNLEDIVVLVPFRNEEQRIDVLLESIKKLTTFPKLFLFIDDHSTDNAVQKIEALLTDFPVEIISTPEGIQGKKMALRFGMSQCSSKYLLTFDADVEFSSTYFEELATLQESPMYLQPAIMKAKTFWEHLYEIDLALINAVNVGMAGLKRPLMASGANLLYERSVFDEVDSIEEHGKVASGDDMYLLKDYRDNEKEVRLVSTTNHAIITETPQSFREFIDQRLRWLGKTSDLKDHLSTGLAILQSLLTFLFFALLVYSIAQGDWEDAMILFSSKMLIDFVVFFPYFKRIKRLSTWLFIPLYELLFPFYTLIILTLMFWYKPKWKGRVISHK